MEDNSFFDTACVNAAGKAKRCELADPATLASKTPPSTCTIYLADDGTETCSAWTPGCTPGPRNVEPGLEARVEAVEDKTRCMTATAAKTTFDGCAFEVRSDLGDIVLDSRLGKVDVTALTSVGTKAGASSIVLSPAMVDVNGVVVQIDANSSFDARGAIATLKGSAVATIEGGLTNVGGSGAGGLAAARVGDAVQCPSGLGVILPPGAVSTLVYP